MVRHILCLWYSCTVVYVYCIVCTQQKLLPESRVCIFVTDVVSISGDCVICLENLLIIWLPYFEILVFVCCVVCFSQNLFPAVRICDCDIVEQWRSDVVCVWSSFPPEVSSCNLTITGLFCVLAMMSAPCRVYCVNLIWHYCGICLLCGLHPTIFASWRQILWIWYRRPVISFQLLVSVCCVVCCSTIYLLKSHFVTLTLCGSRCCFIFFLIIFFM